ncbi:hypothetical protein AB870_02660 [Pandoraea faecigallinarum]|uniref:DUF2635 domain-containing protein n=1 Tax=Pandoraea faecigallinarum TaxID=656179 RepID=A0A0H3WMX5_9BURK|nr:DUF2635 domain-containing protein [Pandoraea faecigallinarum]AKM29264.1 hypothetical protein AB870_02660 [Pandoraea faecigallinarum]
MFIKPAPGIKLRDPETKQFIPESGQEVGDFDLYWVRRVNDGDAIRVSAETPEPSSAKTSKSA